MNEVTLLAWQVACGVGVLLIFAAAAVWGLCREHKRGLDSTWQAVSDSCYSRGLMRGRMEVLERITAQGRADLSRKILTEIAQTGNGRRDWGAVLSSLREARELLKSAQRTLRVEDYGDSLTAALKRVERLLEALEEPRCESRELTAEQAIHLLSLAIWETVLPEGWSKPRKGPELPKMFIESEGYHGGGRMRPSPGVIPQPPPPRQNRPDRSDRADGLQECDPRFTTSGLPGVIAPFTPGEKGGLSDEA